MSDLQLKYNKLISLIKSYESAAVAFSGGVDSTFLLYAAKQALADKCIAVTICSKSFPIREYKEACEYTAVNEIERRVITVDEFTIEHFAENPPDRCYYCKRALFTKMQQTAKELNLSYVLEGSNKDDEGDWRPGMRAVGELGIKSPLKELSFTKAEIRALSRELGLPTWSKPSFACLATRFPYGETITPDLLIKVDTAEQALYSMGFTQVRVRCHNNVARIEVVQNEINKFLDADIREKAVKAVKKAGFSYVSLDLSGYRTGSLNEVL